MTNDDRLKNVMSQVLNVPVETITPEASMDTIESWDSLHHMNLVLAIEDEFKVTIPDEDAGNITSYKLISLVLTELLQKKG